MFVLYKYTTFKVKCCINKKLRNSTLKNIFICRGSNTIQNTTVLNSGNDYVLYSMLKVSNVSFNIILREVYNHSERTKDILPQILKINESKLTLKL